MQGARRSAWHEFLGELSGPGRAFALGLVLMTGCESKDVKACHAKMAASQQTLNALSEAEDKELSQVEEALSEVEETLAACRAAERTEEVADVSEAQRELEALREQIQQRAGKPDRKALTEEERAKLVASGDPSCPTGEGYEVGPEDQLVRCTGPRLADMNASQAKTYFEERGYNLQEDASQLSAEFGATRYEFSYASGKANQPTCVEVTAPPGVPWKETVARLTAVHPSRLERGEAVQAGARRLPLEVEGEGQYTVFLGRCEQKGDSSAQVND